MRVTILQYPQPGLEVWIVHAVGYRRSTALTSTGIDQGSPEPGTRTGDLLVTSPTTIEALVDMKLWLTS